MAGTNISLKDWLLGWIISNPKPGGTGSVGIPAVVIVDETGASTASNGASSINIARVGGAALATGAGGLLPTGPDSLVIPPSSLNSAGVLFTQDMTGYESVSVQVTSAGTTCTITYETSDDATTWYGISGIAPNLGSSNTSSPASTSTTLLVLTFPRKALYFRARVSTYGSGLVTVLGTLHKNPQVISNRATMDGAGVVGTAPATFVPTGLVSRTTNVAAVATTTLVQATATVVGVQIVRPYSIPELDWQYAAASGGIVDTADNVLVASAGAGIRNYLTWISLLNTDATVGTEVVVKDGSTVIFRTFVPASLAAVSQPMPVGFTFPTPLKGTAATALNVACITTSSQTYVNAGGYQAP